MSKFNTPTKTDPTVPMPSSISVTDEYPWFHPEVIRWLDALIQPDWTVLETGMGGSTVFFARRADLVISYESDARYFEETIRVLHQKWLANVDARYRRDYPQCGLELQQRQRDTLTALAGSIRPQCDLAVIDGRGRVRSVLDAIPALKPSGWLVLDDSQRERYAEAIRALETWGEQVIFRCGEDETRAWRKPL